MFNNIKLENLRILISNDDIIKIYFKKVFGFDIDPSSCPNINRETLEVKLFVVDTSKYVEIKNIVILPFDFLIEHSNVVRANYNNETEKVLLFIDINDIPNDIQTIFTISEEYLKNKISSAED